MAERLLDLCRCEAISRILDLPILFSVPSSIGEQFQDLISGMRAMVQRGRGARPMVRDVVIAVLLCLTVLLPLAGASESHPTKSEIVQPPLKSTKTDQLPLAAKPHTPEGDAKPGDRAKAATNGGAALHPMMTPPPPAEIMGKDGAPMVLVPAGEFTMGSDKGDDDESPIHRVYLNAFYLDKFEVTNGRFAKFVDAIQSEPPWGFADKETPVTSADQPVRWVSWMDAMGYCLWVGKRLPTEAEWEKAARGTDGRMFPWGNDPPTLAHAVYGLKEGGAEAISVIGDRDRGMSPYGAHDMAGNLYEWVMDWYAEDFYLNVANNTAVNPRGPSEGTAKVQRGGSYINSPYRLRSSFRTKGDPTEQDPHVGFRCAQDVPKPHSEPYPGTSPSH